MTKHLVFCLVVSALLSAAPLSARINGGDGETTIKAKTKGVSWAENYADGLKTAKAKKKKVFIVFTSPW